MMLQTVLGLIFAIGWVPLFVFRAEARGAALPSYAGAERRWVQVTPIVLAVHVTAACVTISLTASVSPWSAALAALTFMGAIAFWFWGRVLIGPLRVRRLPYEPPRQLHRHGAFGIVRHPLYCGYLAAAGAPLIVAPRPCLFITYALCIVALAVRSTQEERRLRAQLGTAYDVYCREVRRLVPFVW